MKHNPSMQMTVMSKVDRIWILNTSFKMADEDTSLDELIEQAQALLEQEKPQKRKAGESEFEFYWDSVSGHRINKQILSTFSKAIRVFKISDLQQFWRFDCLFALVGFNFVHSSPLFEHVSEEKSLLKLYLSILGVVSLQN